MALKIKVGEIFEIPLSDDRRAYGQYVFRDPKMGPLIRIFDRISRSPIEIEELRNSKPLFPPVLTGLYAAISSGLWKIVGYLPVEDFIYPKFISTNFDLRSGQTGVWYLWDGQRSRLIGSQLPEKYKQLEFLVGWAPQDVATRIETGQLQEPYRTLIKENRLVAPQ